MTPMRDIDLVVEFHVDEECDCMDWWSILFFGIIPIITVTFVFFVMRKALWISPLISTALGIGVSLLKMPTIGSYGEHRSMFFALVVPGQFVIGIILTVVAYLIAYLLKQKQK